MVLVGNKDIHNGADKGIDKGADNDTDTDTAMDTDKGTDMKYNNWVGDNGEVLLAGDVWLGEIHLSEE